MNGVALILKSIKYLDKNALRASAALATSGRPHLRICALLRRAILREPNTLASPFLVFGSSFLLMVMFSVSFSKRSTGLDNPDVFDE